LHELLNRDVDVNHQARPKGLPAILTKAMQIAYFVTERPSEMVQYMCNLKMCTALGIASHFGNLPAVKLLLRHRADVRLANASRRTPLMLAAIRGHIDIVRNLLAVTTSSSQVDCWGRTSLQWAHLHGHDEIVELLREHCPDDEQPFRFSRCSFRKQQGSRRASQIKTHRVEEDPLVIQPYSSLPQRLGQELKSAGDVAKCMKEDEDVFWLGA